jgi:hypothetical protein
LYAYNTVAQGPCDSIVLFTQSDIDQFPSRYKNCNKVRKLTIDDRQKTISNFDSLYILYEVTGSLDVKVINKLKESIFGFRNLRKVNIFNSNFPVINDVFVSLDTIGELYLGQQEDDNAFKMFKNVRHIASSLGVSLEGLKEESTPRFNTNNDFNLRISLQNATKSQAEVLASRLVPSKIKFLHISNGDGFDLGFFPHFNSLRSLYFSYNKNSNFSAVSRYDRLTILTIQDDLGNNNYGDGFVLVDTLDYLGIGNTKSMQSPEILFKNLKYINEGFTFYGNDFLRNLKFLENVDMPETRQDPYSLISIRQNWKISDCNIPLMCKALKFFPDRFWISNNAGKCNMNEIRNYCKLTQTENESAVILRVVPNPVIDKVVLETSIALDRIDLIDSWGHVVAQSKTNEIDMINLPTGTYIVRCIGLDHVVHYRRIVKI